MNTYKAIKELESGDRVNNCEVFANCGGLIIYRNGRGIYEQADFTHYINKLIKVN